MFPTSGEKELFQFNELELHQLIGPLETQKLREFLPILDQYYRLRLYTWKCVNSRTPIVGLGADDNFAIAQTRHIAQDNNTSREDLYSKAVFIFNKMTLVERQQKSNIKDNL
jgi:hypothetical protein